MDYFILYFFGGKLCEWGARRKGGMRWGTYILILFDHLDSCIHLGLSGMHNQ